MLKTDQNRWEKQVQQEKIGIKWAHIFLHLKNEKTSIPSKEAADQFQGLSKNQQEDKAYHRQKSKIKI